MTAQIQSVLSGELAAVLYGLGLALGAVGVFAVVIVIALFLTRRGL